MEVPLLQFLLPHFKLLPHLQHALAAAAASWCLLSAGRALIPPWGSSWEPEHIVVPTVCWPAVWLTMGQCTPLEALGAAAHIPASGSEAASGAAPVVTAVQRHAGVRPSDELWLATALLVPEGCCGTVLL